MDRPIAAPSANRSGRVSPTTANHVADDYPGSDLMIVDGGPCRVGIESTIVRAEPDRVEILRPGGITRDAIEDAVPVPVTRGRQDRIEAPGMLASHYAPRSSMMLDVLDCPSAAALMAFGSGSGKDRRGAAIMLNLSENGDLREAAANLYNHLKALDAVSTSVIAVEPVPMEGLGAAINDRLARAAAPRGR
jgi:L-threonylcarbamoyladenylate synthase